jgi:hypothetical protein
MTSERLLRIVSVLSLSEYVTRVAHDRREVVSGYCQAKSYIAVKADALDPTKIFSYPVADGQSVRWENVQVSA